MLDPLSLQRIDVFLQDGPYFFRAYNGQSFFELEGNVVRSYSVDPFLQMSRYELRFSQQPLLPISLIFMRWSKTRGIARFASLI
ncbi:MAG: hypothetical protein R3C28_19450 [Pirellulaceae bacterium]